MFGYPALLRQDSTVSGQVKKSKADDEELTTMVSGMMAMMSSNRENKEQSAQTRSPQLEAVCLA
jgi:hypothetical protein